MMAKYWSTVGGIPSERIRRLFDSRALKSASAEAFEEWLPKQVDPTTVVYVFIAGRGLVDPATGAVLLIPFDGAGASSARLFFTPSVARGIKQVAVSACNRHPRSLIGASAQRERGSKGCAGLAGRRAGQGAYYVDGRKSRHPGRP